MRGLRRTGRTQRLFRIFALCLVLLTGCASDGAQPRVATFDEAGGQVDDDQVGEDNAADPHGGHARDAPEQQQRDPARLSVGGARKSSGVIAAGGRDAVYNYGPSVMLDGATTRMWWCSQYASASPAGDDILYGAAASIDGPFVGPGGGSPAAVVSGNPAGFDAKHTCDPSVIRVDGTFYMYYTGAAGDHAHGNAIGLATSTDGVRFRRANGGEPIVRPAHDTHRDNVYGAGQPSAVYLDGWFYLMFTDTTGAKAGWNGAGQFVLRSRDPAFSGAVEALGPGGFASVPTTETARTRPVVDAFSADLMWVDALGAFAIAHETAGGTTITFWNRTFSHHPYRPVLVGGPWEEGPGLVRQARGHAPIPEDEPCATVPIDVVRATTLGESAAPTGLRHFGIDLRDVGACAARDRALAVLDGFAVPSAVRTMNLVVDGAIVRVQRRSVAAELADGVLNQRPEALDQLPVATRIPAGAPAVTTAQGRYGFVLDGTLWPVRDKRAVERNDSPVRTISTAKWNSYPRGSTLGAR